MNIVKYFQMLKSTLTNVRATLQAKGLMYEIIETFVISFILITVIYNWIALPELVWGASMEPTFYSGERILVEKVSPRFKNFQRGEIVVLHPPDNNRLDYIKRVIGLPGDVVKVFNCRVYITRDDKKFELEESYLESNACTKEGLQFKEGRSVKLGEDEYFVLGDNRDRSLDSRVFGTVIRKEIIGRVALRFWPLSKFGVI